MTNGIQLITAERIRQAKKYDAAHDDGSLAQLAAYIACPDGHTQLLPVWAVEEADRLVGEYATDPIRLPVIAGALIAAEIDRRLRIMGEVTYAPPAKWAECVTDAQRVEHVAGQASDYRAWQDEFDDADSGPAFDFAGEAAQFYLPWCVSRIRELEAKVDPVGRFQAFDQQVAEATARVRAMDAEDGGPLAFNPILQQLRVIKEAIEAGIKNPASGAGVDAFVMMGDLLAVLGAREGVKP